MKQYRVELTENAEVVYRHMAKEAKPHLDKGDGSHPKVKVLRMIDECLDKIIPYNPFDTKRALSGALSGIYRVKKGRLRICYVASSETLIVTVLYISDTLRKDGDKSDPYVIFTNMLMSGRYDQLFEKLGLKKPKR